MYSQTGRDLAKSLKQKNKFNDILRGGSSVDERRAHIRQQTDVSLSRAKKIYCEVEQLVARRAHNPKVVRSSRALATSLKGQFLLTFFLYPFFTTRSRMPMHIFKRVPEE